VDQKCPINSKPLSATNADGVGVLTCAICDGCWLPGNGVKGFFSKSPDGATREEEFRESVRVQGRPSNLRCVDCSTRMRVLVHRGVEIDTCPNCAGIWFDGGELRSFLQTDRGRTAARGAGAAMAGGAALGVAGLAGAAALNADASAQEGNSLASTVADVAVSGAVDIGGDILGAIFGALFD